MSILIRDMEMPEDGCHHIICIYADGTVATGRREYRAIPVPPHGRLIDESAIDLSKYEKAAHDALHNCKGSIMYDSGVLAGARAITQLVRRAPTIIPAEDVGHG